MKKLKKIILFLFQKLFEISFLDLKLRPDTFSVIFTGVGTGVVANIMFVLTTSSNFSWLSLTISFVSAIIILALGSLERKDK